MAPQPARRGYGTWLAIAWFVGSTGLLIAPAFMTLGNHITPRVFGLPWSLVYVLGLIAANFVVLLVLYRRGVVDSEEPEGDT